MSDNSLIKEQREYFSKIYPLICTDKFLDSIPVGPILDIGFEEGHSLAFFSSPNDPRGISNESSWDSREVWGVDKVIDPSFKEMLSQFETEPKIIPKDFFEISNEAPNENFAFILLSKVIHFYEWDEGLKMIKKAAKLLVDGGLLFIRVYSLDQPQFKKWTQASLNPNHPDKVKLVNKAKTGGVTFSQIDPQSHQKIYQRFFGEKELTLLIENSGLIKVFEKKEVEPEANGLGYFISAVAKKPTNKK